MLNLELGNGTLTDSSTPVQVKVEVGVGFLKPMNNGISGEAGQVASNDNDRFSFFGCGSIDMKGGSGPG